MLNFKEYCEHLNESKKIVCENIENEIKPEISTTAASSENLVKAKQIAKQFAEKHGLVINDEPDYYIQEGEDGEYYGVCDEGMFIAQYQINNMLPFSLFIVPENQTIGISNGDSCMLKIEENEIQLSEEDFQSCMYDILEWDKFDDLSELLESDNM